MPVVTRTASLSLDVIVVGGGIGGLAVAYVLSKSGHNLTVLEQYDLIMPGGGMRVPPNLSKILKQWIGQEELMKVATPCVGSPFYNLHTGEYVGYLPWQPAVMAETGGEFLLTHHEDLLMLVNKLAIEAGARVRRNTPVIAVKQGSTEAPRPSVTLANGEVLSADLVIGADGARSLVRETILQGDDCGQHSGLTVYTGIVSGEAMLADPELAPLLLSDDSDRKWALWMGEHRAVCGHPVRSKKEYYYSLYSWPGDNIEQSDDVSWDGVCRPYQTNVIRAETNCALLNKLVDATTQITRTQFLAQPEDGNRDWVDSSGRIVLLGNAAHPLLPGGTQTASLAVEDAVVLGSLLSHVRKKEQIASFLHAYQELRQPRCNYAIAADVKHAQSLAFPRGPEADARDANIRRPLDDWDEGRSKAQFEEIAELFVYDAGDAAEDWWMTWGRLHDAAREHPSIVDIATSSVSVQCSV